MSDKKKNTPKPRFTPVVEDVELPTADLAPKPPQEPPKRPDPVPEKASSAKNPADFDQKQPDTLPDSPKTGQNLPKNVEIARQSPDSSDSGDGKRADAESAITESGMIRRDDEIDHSIFDPADGTDPDQIGFSPNTEVSPAALIGAAEDAGLSFGNLEIEEPEQEAKIVRRVKVRTKTERGASLRTLAFGIGYLTAVILLGILLGIKIVGIGNDMFAFTFESDEEGKAVSYTVVIEDEGMSPAEVGKLLKDAGVIKYDWVFKLYAQIKKKDNFTVKAGTYQISADANYDAIMSLLNPTAPREEITITFTEGMNTDEIINLFLENGIGTKEGFENALNNYPYSYWFMDYLRTSDLPEGRFYRLDGYLYPDTYRFFSDTSEIAAIDKLLENFNKKFGEEYKTACDELGMTPDEVVRVASMIEAEVRHAVDYIQVSAVFHNRMQSDAFGGLLQSDATVQYYFFHVEGMRHEEITPEDLQTQTPYNTYVSTGLPPGAVCNPSLTALRAALYPEPDCPYYYFVSRPNGYMYYARTLDEHNANIEKVREESENASGGVGEYE